MADEISIDLTILDLELIIRSLEEFKKSEKYLNYKQKAKDDFDQLVKKLKES